MKYSNIILLSDLDGTLLNTDTELSQNNIDAINFFMSEGGRFGIATGRGISNVAKILPDLPVNFQSIFFNGSILYDKQADKVIKARYLDKDNVLPVVQNCLLKYPDIAIQVCTAKDGYFVSDKNRTNKMGLEDHIPYNFTDIEVVTKQDWTKVLFISNLKQLELVETSAAKLKEDKIVDDVYSGEIYYELLPCGSNKGAMAKHIKKGQDDVIYAVGNYYNDVEMIEFADVGIFSQNTPEDLKTRGLHKHICKDCDNDAIADVIYNIIG